MGAPAIHKVWDWKGEGEAAERHPFNPHFDATASAEGVKYMCEIQGPFCGYDWVGTQTWAQFFTYGPPDDIGMPASIVEAIREFAREHKLA